MLTILLILVIVLKIIQYSTLLDVVLWRFGIQIKFLREMYQPWYDYVWNIIPSNLWMFDFSPLIIMFICEIIIQIIYSNFHLVEKEVNHLTQLISF